MIRMWTIACLIWPGAGLAAPPYEPPASEVAMVRSRFEPLQHLSFAVRFEYCGYLGRNPSGHLAFTVMTRGDENGCTPILPKSGFTPIASLHTHGAYDAYTPAEIPTVLDLEADRDEGVNGYVATPGGRLWYINSSAMITYQICGLACLPQDPGFRPGDDGIIKQTYTHEELMELEYTH